MASVALQPNHPNANVTVRCCTYCRRPNHNIRHCHEGFRDSMQLHRDIVETIEVNLVNPDNIDPIVRVFLNSLTLRKLKQLTLIHHDLNMFTFSLYNNNLITLTQTGLYTKRDIVVVLSYYYKTIYINFLGLIERRPELLQQANDPDPREPIKFNIDVLVIPSDKEETFDCPICIDKVDDSKRITTNCNHDVCSTCFENYLSGIKSQNLKEAKCCLCRTIVTSVSFTDVEYCNDIKNKFLV